MTGAIFPKRYANAVTRHEQKKTILYHATSVVTRQLKTVERNNFVISSIVSIVSSPYNKEDQDKVHAIKHLLQCSMSSAYRQKKGFYKTWIFHRSSPQYSVEMVYQTMHCSNKKS